MTEFSRIGRERLPDRRLLLTDTTQWTGRDIHITVGFSDDLRPLEVFVRDASRVDSDLDCVIDDAAVLISRALQHGDTLNQIAAGLGRFPDGQPTSIMGAILDKTLEIVSHKDELILTKKNLTFVPSDRSKHIDECEDSSD